MENKDNPHLKLAEMGVETWNRWARTLMGDEAIDALRLSNEKKQALKVILPLNNEEQVKLAEKLGLNNLNELERKADFRGFETGCCFSGFLFPGSVSFFKATFSGVAYFSDTTFSALVGLLILLMHHLRVLCTLNMQNSIPPPEFHKEISINGLKK